MIFPPRRMAPGEHLTAALYNELLDYVRRTTPIQGRGTSVDYTLAGCRIGVSTQSSDGSIHPFRVRYHVNQWEVYLPTGCCTAGRPCTPVNRTAEDADEGHADEDGWYAIPIDEGLGDAEVIEESVSGDETASTSNVRTFRILAHVKASAKIDGEDPLDDTPASMVLVSAHKVRVAGETIPEETVYRYFEGDLVSFVVAEVEIISSGEDGGDNGRTVKQLRSTPFEVPAPAASAFDLQWYFRRNADLDVSRVYCTRGIVNAAGVQIGDMSAGGGDETMTDVTGAERTIHARVRTDPLSADVHGSVSVVKDASGHTVRTDHLTWLLLYQMKFNCVVADYRQTALANVQIYR